MGQLSTAIPFLKYTQTQPIKSHITYNALLRSNYNSFKSLAFLKTILGDGAFCMHNWGTILPVPVFQLCICVVTPSHTSNREVICSFQHILHRYGPLSPLENLSPEVPCSHSQSWKECMEI